MCLDNSLSNIRNFRLNSFMNGRISKYKYMNIPKVFCRYYRAQFPFSSYLYYTTKYTLLLYYWATFFQNQMYLETTYYLFSVRSNKNPTSEILNDFNIESQTIFRLVQQEIGVKSKFRIS